MYCISFIIFDATWPYNKECQECPFWDPSVVPSLCRFCSISFGAANSFLCYFWGDGLGIVAGNCSVGSVAVHFLGAVCRKCPRSKVSRCAVLIVNAVRCPWPISGSGSIGVLGGARPFLWRAESAMRARPLFLCRTLRERPAHGSIGSKVMNSLCLWLVDGRV